MKFPKGGKIFALPTYPKLLDHLCLLVCSLSDQTRYKVVWVFQVVRIFKVMKNHQHSSAIQQIWWCQRVRIGKIRRNISSIQHGLHFSNNYFQLFSCSCEIWARPNVFFTACFISPIFLSQNSMGLVWNEVQCNILHCKAPFKVSDCKVPVLPPRQQDRTHYPKSSYMAVTFYWKIV